MYIKPGRILCELRAGFLAFLAVKDFAGSRCFKIPNREVRKEQPQRARSCGEEAIH